MKSRYLIPSVLVALCLLPSAAFAPLALAAAPNSSPVRIISYGVLNEQGHTSKTLHNGQGYFPFFVLRNRSNNSLGFNAEMALDGQLRWGWGGGILGQDASLLSPDVQTAATGTHTVTIYLCSDSSCTSFIQTITFQFTVT